jgi:hypothetical protein
MQIFSGPTPMGLVAIIYCLRFETSLFVASYDSQGYGGDIRPLLHTGGIEFTNQLPFYNFKRTEYRAPRRTVNSRFDMGMPLLIFVA